jgi:hypothetical protein
MKKILKSIMIVTGLAIATSAANAQVSVGLSISAGIAPPAIPVYEQPVCPSDGYVWQPGYWAYDPTDGYYWVPGVWVAPPTVDVYWTPCWWGFSAGVYGFHAGYWGPHVGFYGGVNYGFGYNGDGFYGGRWDHGHFAYNSAAWHVNRTIVHNTYVNNTYVHNSNHYSFNGPGGAHATPNREQMMAEHDRHISATSAQMSHQSFASHNRAQFASANHGHPAVTAMNRPNGRAFSCTC